MIKHLVISGGGPTGLLYYGALKHLFEQKFISIENIKSIYGTSVGAIIGVLISLKYDWKTLDDYFLKRPWDKVFKIAPDNLFDLYSNKGMFQFSMVKEILQPLLTAKDLSVDITLQEFYEYNQIDLHCFTAEMNSFTKIDLNHTTYPELSLIKALEMTSAVPIIFKPIIENNKCYVDGGLFDNYPITECLHLEKCNENEILGIKNKWSNTEEIINSEMNIFQYLQASMNKIITHVQLKSAPNPIRYELKCICDKKLADYSTWFEYLTKVENMKELIHDGKTYADLFLQYEKELGSNV